MRRSTMCERHGAAALWLAQHADDQAETVLLQLLRGAGIAGLAAMAPRYRPDGVSVERVRPLLRLLRAQLERYATQRDLAWIDDESNNDTRYARNALRIDVLPALAVHFPGFRDALGRAAQHAAAAQRLLDDLAELDFAVAARDDGQALSRDALVAFDDTRGANLLRFWMRRLGLPGASAARLANMMRQLRATHVAHALRVDHAGQCLRLYRDVVYWEAGDSSEPADDGTGSPHPEAMLAWDGRKSGTCRGGAARSCSRRPRREAPTRCRRRCCAARGWRRVPARAVSGCARRRAARAVR